MRSTVSDMRERPGPGRGAGRKEALRLGGGGSVGGKRKALLTTSVLGLVEAHRASQEGIFLSPLYIEVARVGGRLHVLSPCSGLALPAIVTITATVGEAVGPSAVRAEGGHRPELTATGARLPSVAPTVSQPLQRLAGKASALARSGVIPGG